MDVRRGGGEGFFSWHPMQERVLYDGSRRLILLTATNMPSSVAHLLPNGDASATVLVITATNARRLNSLSLSPFLFFILCSDFLRWIIVERMRYREIDTPSTLVDILDKHTTSRDNCIAVTLFDDTFFPLDSIRICLDIRV